MRNKVSERCLAEAGRPVKKDMLRRSGTLFGGTDQYMEVVFDALLADVLVPRGRAEGLVEVTFYISFGARGAFGAFYQCGGNRGLVEAIVAFMFVIGGKA